MPYDMLVLKTTPIGLDWYLQQTQMRMYRELLKVWGADKNYMCYGRCYRNKTKSGYTAEVLDSGNEYREVLWDDSCDAVSFFGVSKIEKSAADVHLVFFCNLKTLRPDVPHRADNEVRQDVMNAVGLNSYGLTYESTDLWLENVLKEYGGSRSGGRLSTVDMHPVHCFRFNYELFYNPNKNC